MCIHRREMELGEDATCPKFRDANQSQMQLRVEFEIFRGREPELAHSLLQHQQSAGDGNLRFDSHLERLVSLLLTSGNRCDSYPSIPQP